MVASFGRVLSVIVISVAVAGAQPAWASGGGQGGLAAGQAWTFSLTNTGLLGLATQEESTAESTTVTTYGDQSWDLKGPYFLRSADPEEAGEMDLKLVYAYETSSEGGDDDSEFEFVLEWGMTEDIELILEVPVEIGDGGIHGNADIIFGFHTRFWKEDGWIPAVAMRNLMRIPNGHESSGVDYIGRLLVTKTLIPGKLRAHLNPFLESVNGHNDEDARDFQWGAAIGVDYVVSDNLVLIADYLHRSSDEEGHRNNHALELGADWKIADNQYLAFGAELGLDGDESGENFAFRVSYIYSIGAPRLDGR